MILNEQLAKSMSSQFVTLILDNEVTVGYFVAEPPFPWTRVVQLGGPYQAVADAPVPLTAGQTKIEMKIWDEVLLQGIMDTLKDLNGSVDYALIGNNAGQGIPLARCLDQSIKSDRAAVIYGTNLPEQREYEQMGYRTFFPRAESVPRLLQLAQGAGRPLALYFINTIQHNESNYHDP